MRIARIATPEALTFATVESDGTFRAIAGHPFQEPQYTGKTYTAQEVKLLAPLLPSKIVAMGYNYRDHVADMAERTAPVTPPSLFLMPPTAVIGPGAAIKIPDFAKQVEFEAELGLVIGRPVKNVRKEDWRSAVLGLTIVNDVSSRSLQFSDGQWARAKSIDTFLPIGPWIETDLDKCDLEDQPIKAHLTHDGHTETKQDSSTRHMIMSPGEIIEMVTATMTLLPGDVIATGSPAGNAEMVPGDTITIEIPGLGELTNPVVRA